MSYLTNKKTRGIFRVEGEPYNESMMHRYSVSHDVHCKGCVNEEGMIIHSNGSVTCKHCGGYIGRIVRGAVGDVKKLLNFVDKGTIEPGLVEKLPDDIDSAEYVRAHPDRIVVAGPVGNYAAKVGSL